MFNKPNRRDYGAMPFWAWNGKLEKDELLRQVDIIKKMGFGGFFMHSRTGLVTEYLGKEWFELINACADEAEKDNLQAWLYDEDRWPSGSAGGLATVEEKYRMKYLRMNIVIPSVFEWSDDIICAFCADIDGINAENCFEISHHTDISDLGTKNIVYFTTETMIKSDYYNGYTYLDTMSAEAVKNYIDITHEKYKAECGNRIGQSIQGIFTDEPHRGDVMCGFNCPNRDPLCVTPYTDDLFSEFEKAFGYKLQENLPELFLRKDGKVVSQVKWHYMELITRLFVKNYAIQYQDWCRKNNMLVTGHILHEDSLTAQACMMGSVMRYYEHMDVPGVDVLTEGNRAYCIVKQLSSVARQTGKKLLLSELNGCTGWQMTFQNYKAIGDWQAIMGITLRCPHLSWYTMQGEAKRDYPASILHQSAWYEAYSALEDYYTRISELVANSHRECNTLVVSAVESIWAQIYTGWAHSLSPESPQSRELDEKYAKLYNTLLSLHIDFDYADEEMLGRMGKIDKNALYVGQARYKKVIIYGMTTMRRTTLNLLSAFADEGGEVLFVDDMPEYVNALPSDEAVLLADKTEKLRFDELVSLNTKTKINCPEILLQTYSDEHNTYYFLLNINRTEPQNEVNILFNDQILPQLWSAFDGKKYYLGEGTDKLVLNFEPGELKIIVDAGEGLSAAEPIETYNVSGTTLPQDSAKIFLSEPNVLVLDYVKFSVNDSEKSDETEVLLADVKIREGFGLTRRGGTMLQPWVTAKCTLDVKGKVVLDYCFSSDIKPHAPLYLMLEEPENFDISINGTPVEKKFADGFFIDKCFYRIEVSALICEGENTVTLTTNYKENSNLEAIYLLGDFCVEMPQKKLIASHNTVSLSSLSEQGFPFYGGKVKYTLCYGKEIKDDQRAFIKLDGYENAACFEVGGKVLAFPPYECDVTDELKRSGNVEVSVYLTRRNLFGPLHGIPKYPGVIGPDHFYGGESRDYVLFDSGLLQKPQIEIRTYGGEND